MESTNDEILAKFKQREEDMRRRLEFLKEAKASQERERLAAFQAQADGVLSDARASAMQLAELLAQHDFPLEVGKAASFTPVIVEGRELATWRLSDEKGKPGHNYVTYDGKIYQLQGWRGEERVPFYEPPKAEMRGSGYDQRDFGFLEELGTQIKRAIKEISRESE